MESGNTLKQKRHIRILELITAEDIETQEELSALLQRSGFNVTQATVSRDIRELRLTKSVGANGEYKYTVPKGEGEQETNKYRIILNETVISCESAHSVIVIKTYVGMAQAACAALDHIGWSSIVGTIAGDDTIFAAAKSPQEAAQTAESIKRILKKEQ